MMAPSARTKMMMISRLVLNSTASRPQRCFSNSTAAVTASESSSPDMLGCGGPRMLVKEYEDYRRSLYGGLTHKALLVDAVGTLVVPSQPMAQVMVCSRVSTLNLKCYVTSATKISHKVASSCSNEEFKALVLEYMPHNYCLDLMERLSIMVDVASALEYLHHGYVTPVVHFDQKPSNVLLDEEMVVHVSDFGIAKLLGTYTLATLGYMAPGKKPTDDMFGGDVCLRSWVERSLFDSSCQVMDSNSVNPGEENFNKKSQCVSSVMELTLRCSAEHPTEQLNMKEALAQLQKFKKSISSVR